MPPPIIWRGRALEHSLDSFARDNWKLSVESLNVRVCRLSAEAMDAYEIKAVPNVSEDGHFYIAWLEVPSTLASRGVADNAHSALEAARVGMLESTDRVLAAVGAIDVSLPNLIQHVDGMLVDDASGEPITLLHYDPRAT